jgi:hypothetical protein
MITIACWKWERIKTGHQLPNVCDYSVSHVHKMKNMLERNVTIPYRFVCITDDPTGLECETIPLWEKYEGGGCYHRLRVFDPDFDLLGDRFAWIDLDAVIVDNIDSILTVDADFAINRYPYGGRPHQHYNGALVVMNRGARPQVWKDFNPHTTPRFIANLNDEKRLLGSDQAWISHILGPNERKFDEKDGVYESFFLEKKPNQPRRFHSTLVRDHIPIKELPKPQNAKIILFSGPRDPHTTELSWIREYYK